MKTTSIFQIVVTHRCSNGCLDDLWRRKSTVNAQKFVQVLINDTQGHFFYAFYHDKKNRYFFRWVWIKWIKICHISEFRSVVNFNLYSPNWMTSENFSRWPSLKFFFKNHPMILVPDYLIVFNICRLLVFTLSPSMKSKK